MHDFPLLKDIIILLSASILTSIFSHRIKVPSIVGFIIGGVIIGPFGIGLISEVELVNVMAEIGVVLLLFTIGIEFSIEEIKKIGARGLGAAVMQIMATIAAAYGLATLLHIPAVESLFFGFVVTLSSTAIVIRLYTDRGEMNSPVGRLSLGTLLTQDMAIVPMVLFIQIFGGEGGTSLLEVGSALGIALVAVVGIILAAYYIVPLFLHQIVRLKSPEVLTMAGIFICLGTAWTSSHFGLSLALGAFIAGIVISESEYSHQITASVLPFRDIFNSIFFISIGMLIRLDNLLLQWMPILILTALIILFKTLIISFVFLLTRYPARLAFTIGLGLAQVGEFSFVLLKIGEDLGVISQLKYQLFLSSTVLSMILTPLLVLVAPRLASRLPDITPKKWKKLDEATMGGSSVINHVIIAGYGLMGQHLANVLNKTGIAYIVVDINNENVRKAKAEGHMAFYGDTSYGEVLKSVGITAAKVMVFCISDPVGTRRGITIARELNPDMHVIVRTKYMGEIADLIELGASQVIPEEFETSVEIFSRVLKEYKIPGNIIQNQVDMIRLEGYSMLRGLSIPMEKITQISSVLAASVSENFYVEEGSAVAGRSIRELNIRGAGGASIIAVVKGAKTRTNPPANYVIECGDILVLLGSHAEIANALAILNSTKEDIQPDAQPETQVKLS